MESGELPYPKTGVYRANKAEIHKHAGVLMEAFQQRDAEAVFQELFGFDTETFESITSDEACDVWNFAEYATKRLAAASVESAYVRRPGLSHTELFHLAPAQGMPHDAMHAMVAYMKSGGASLRPAYTEAATDAEEYGGLQQTEEELMVTLWQSHIRGNFLLQLLRGKTPHELLADLAHSDSTVTDGLLETAGADFLENCRVNAPLKDHDMVEYYLRMLDALYLFDTARFTDPQYHEQVRRRVVELQSVRNPQYVEVVRRVIEDNYSGTRNPKILLHEFQRVLQPLLVRLRENPPHGEVE